MSNVPGDRRLNSYPWLYVSACVLTPCLLISKPPQRHRWLLCLPCYQGLSCQYQIQWSALDANWTAQNCQYSNQYGYLENICGVCVIYCTVHISQASKPISIFQRHTLMLELHVKYIKTLKVIGAITIQFQMEYKLSRKCNLINWLGRGESFHLYNVITHVNCTTWVSTLSKGKAHCMWGGGGIDSS